MVILNRSAPLVSKLPVLLFKSVDFKAQKRHLHVNLMTKKLQDNEFHQMIQSENHSFLKRQPNIPKFHFKC